MNEEQVAWSRRGQAVFRWITGCTPELSVSEISAPDLVYDITEGTQVFITQFDVGVYTVNDDCYFTLVACTETDGGGTQTAVTSDLHVYSGAALAGTEWAHRTFDPPIRVRYSDGYRSISVLMDANDGACTVSAEWQGWYEDEV